MIYLIRHASAGVRNHDDPNDDARPLDDFGRHQAAWIAETLAEATVDRIYSSPALRCQQTVAPLAAAQHLAVQTSTELSEGTSLATAMGFVRQAGDHTVFCLHGDLLPEIVQAFHTAGMYPPADRDFGKGVVWSIELDGDHRPGMARCHMAPGPSQLA